MAVEKNNYLLDLPRLPPRTAKLYEKPPGPLEITSSSSKHEIVHSRYGMLFSVAGGGGVSILVLQDKQFQPNPTEFRSHSDPHPLQGTALPIERTISLDGVH
jgi:hypothetical protein